MTDRAVVDDEVVVAAAFDREGADPDALAPATAAAASLDLEEESSPDLEEAAFEDVVAGAQAARSTDPLLP